MTAAEVNRPDTITQRFRLLTILNRNHFELYAKGIFDKGLETDILNDEQLNQINDATRAVVYLERGSAGKEVKQTLKLKYLTPYASLGGSINRNQAYVAVGYVFPELVRTEAINGFSAENLTVVNR